MGCKRSMSFWFACQLASLTVSTAHDAIDLTTSPLPLTFRHRTASPGDPSGAQRQKRRRLEAGAADPGSDPRSGVPLAETSPTLTQISTWEIPPDVPTAPVATSSSVIELCDEPTSPSRVLPSTATAATPEPLSTYTCPICFSPPTNATLTPCGHVCCGQCLFTAVKSTIRRNMVAAMDRAPAPR
jgi:hypothetical protein